MRYDVWCNCKACYHLIIGGGESTYRIPTCESWTSTGAHFLGILNDFDFGDIQNQQPITLYTHNWQTS